MDGQTAQSVEFLQKLRPNGPWVLTAIQPDKHSISTKTFSNLAEMTSWIDSFQGVRNIYYTLNSVRSSVEKKPEKTDISELYALHCDVDLRVGEDHSTGKQRILAKLENFQPHPSAIIDSGNGYQVIWLLEQPVALEGTIEQAEEYESYNRQLELMLEGDHCFNIDRILRLPGTINVPDEKKVKKGRVPLLASVHEWTGIQFSLIQFTKAPTKIQSKATLKGEVLTGGGERIKLSGNIPPLYVEDLAKKNINISDTIKVLIVQGKDPDNPSKYPSRSEPLFAVCCALARAGADDETIAGVIMNRDNAIASSVLDKPRPDKYARKQIQDAREEVEEPMLRELNSRHAVISDWGGKCRIISETFDITLSRPRISYQGQEDFKLRYCNRRVQIATDEDGQPVMKEAGKWWISHVNRRQYDTIVFAPGKDVPNAYNLWQGFACEAIPGECGLFLDHIKDNVCLGNEEHYNYLLGWMARCVQKPDCTGEVAIIFRGEMGTGKGFVARHFGALFGRHFLQVSDSKHLVGNFNSHLRDCLVLFGDEAFWAGDKKHEAVLKSLVTEPTITIESKGVDVVACPNYTHIIMASNSQWVVPAGANERRFFVLDVSEEKMQNKKYFGAIAEQLKSGGYEALLYFLLNYDISNFEVRDVPKTLGLQEQKLHSMSHEESWWLEKIKQGYILHDADSWETEVMREDLYGDYILFMQRVGAIRKLSPTLLHKCLGKMIPDGEPKSVQKLAKVKQHGNYGEEYTVTRKRYFYLIPALQLCREFWDKQRGSINQWNTPLTPDIQEKLLAPFE